MKRKSTEQRQAMYARVAEATARDLSKEEQEELLTRFPKIAKPEKPRTTRRRANEMDDLIGEIYEELQDEAYAAYCDRENRRFDAENEVRRDKKYAHDDEFDETEEGRVHGQTGRDDVAEIADERVKARAEHKLRKHLDENTRKTADEKQQEHDRKMNYVDRDNRRRRYC